MARRMPILRDRDMPEKLRQPIDDRNDGVALTNRQSAARAEIILHVDDKQQIVAGPNLHFKPLQN
jgi:hypothetical protein